MFERFKFSKKQIDKYYNSAKRDFKIACNSHVPEVTFRFCYDALVKLAIVVCAKQGLRVKARRGHRIELIKKLSKYLNDPEIELLANEMRVKRNKDLYGGGTLISMKEAKNYIQWIRQVFRITERFFDHKQSKLKL
jgi:hypothetical protein